MTGVRHVSGISDSRMVVTKTQTPCRQRRAYLIDGITSMERSLQINDPDVDTLATALLERMYKCEVNGQFLEPINPNRSFVESRLKNFKRRILRESRWTPKVSPEQFVEMYRGRKRTIYENALPEFYTSGVQKKHARAVSFVKCEKVKRTGAPRCIQPRHPVYNIGVGCYLKPNEHGLYEAITRAFGDETPVVMKGFNVRQIADILKTKWDVFGKCVVVGLDAKRFDMHVSRSMLEWEHSIYLILSGKDKELTRLLKMQLDNEGVGYCEDGKLRYKVSGRRFSGDMNTALGNCLIMCALVYEFAHERGVDIRLGNNGDDCVVFMEARDLDRFNEGLENWFLELGFRMAVEPPVYRFSDVEFCQMHPVETVHGWTMVRNFEVAREKDSLSIIPLDSEKMFRKWIFAVGQGGLALTSGVPVFQEMYVMYMRNGLASNVDKHPAMASGARLLARGLAAEVSVVTDMARVTFFEAWGVTPDEQLAIESYYKNLVLTHSVRAIESFCEYTSAPL